MIWITADSEPIRDKQRFMKTLPSWRNLRSVTVCVVGHSEMKTISIVVQNLINVIKVVSWKGRFSSAWKKALAPFKFKANFWVEYQIAISVLKCLIWFKRNETEWKMNNLEIFY